MRGVPVAAAIEHYVEAMKNKQSDGGSDDIELF